MCHGAVQGADGIQTIRGVLFIGCVISLPDYVVVVSQVKFLLVLARVVHNSHAGDEVDYLLGGGVVQVVAALVSPVSVHPLQSQVAVGSSPVSHVRASVCVSLSLSRRLSSTVAFTKKKEKKDLFKRPCVSH